MPQVLFKAFISCSLSDEDATIVDTFKGLIRAFDIEPDIYDYQELGRVPDRVKEHIIKSDCLIALATKRKKLEGNDVWSCPDWIHHEVAIAHAYKKPIAIFFEDGVRIEGLLGTEERRQRFSRDNFMRDIDKITRFLFSLRSHLDSMYSSERTQVPVLLRHFVHVKEEVRSREVTVTRCHILMEALIDQLEATHHSTELEESTPGLSIRPRQFDFVCKEIPAGKRIEIQTLQETDSKHLWRMNFIPPLARGDKVKYAFKFLRQNTRPWTNAEAVERIQRGTYEYPDPRCEACEWSILYPTAEFLYEIEFPEGYEVRDPWVDVRMGEAGLTADTEVTRIREGRMFVAEKIIDKWSFSLRVPKPLPHVLHLLLCAGNRVSPQGPAIDEGRITGRCSQRAVQMRRIRQDSERRSRLSGMAFGCHTHNRRPVMLRRCLCLLLLAIILMPVASLNSHPLSSPNVFAGASLAAREREAEGCYVDGVII